jgi:hypothetical protein
LIVLLGIAACAGKEDIAGPRQATGDGSGDTEMAAGDPRVPPEKTRRSSDWVTEKEMRSWQEQHEANGLWVVGYFLPPGWECYETRRGDLVARWKLLSRRKGKLPRAELVRKALEALEGAAPEALSNALERVSLRVLSMHVEGGTIYLDFDPRIYATNSMGTCGGSAMAVQFLAAVHHYFPEVGQACVLVKGIRSGHEGEALVFHDSIACPMRLDG